ncbi:MAG TPA: YegS/Rv2252/BmrU family lipid kinase [Intrasporangiaceae bacterium]|nr:YegS/Rv2252/BmrU family lipid kinase [Intrasporangiaceae bacterium]
MDRHDEPQLLPGISRIGLVINPTAGARSAGRIGSRVAAELRARQIPFIDLTGADAAQAVRQIREAVTAGSIDCLVAVGGDGMVNLAVNALAESQIPLLIVPAGTGNDAAAAFGLPVGDPVDAVDLLRTGVPHTVDAARVTGTDGAVTWFIGVLAGGFDAIVNERANSISWARGSAKYTLSALLELPVFTPIPYRITIDGVVHDGGAMLVAVANNVSYGGGMKVVPSAMMDDGLLDVLILSELSKLTFIRVFPKVFSGKHVTHPAVRIIRGRRIELDAPGIVAYADGERIGPLPRIVEVVPGAMRIIAARNHRLSTS